MIEKWNLDSIEPYECKLQNSKESVIVMKNHELQVLRIIPKNNMKLLLELSSKEYVAIGVGLTLEFNSTSNSKVSIAWKKIEN
jgi:hypothetical protein